MNNKKFSTDFKNAIEQFSESTGVEAETILEAVFLKYLAEGNAGQKVFGPHNSICTELAKDGNGKFLKGRELYRILEKIAVDKLTQERRAALVARKKSTLTAAEREWLADHREVKK